MSMFSAAMIDPISIINGYKSCTIRKNYKTGQKTMSVLLFNSVTHMQLLWRTINLVSVLTESISQVTARLRHSLFIPNFITYLGVNLLVDVIQSYVTGSDILVSEMIRE